MRLRALRYADMPVIQELDRTLLVSEREPSKVIASGRVRQLVSVQSTAQVTSIDHPTQVQAKGPTTLVESARIILCQGGQQADASWFEAIRTTLTSTNWTQVDILNYQQAQSMTWRVQVEDVVAKTRSAYLVSAAHNGVDEEPTEVNWTIYGKVGFGNLIAQTDVLVKDVDSVKMISLQVKAQPDMRVTVWRLQFGS